MFDFKFVVDGWSARSLMGGSGGRQAGREAGWVGDWAYDVINGCCNLFRWIFGFIFLHLIVSDYATPIRR